MMSPEEERDCGSDENFVKTFVRNLLAFSAWFSPQETIPRFLAAVQKALLRIRTSQASNWLCHKKDKLKKSDLALLGQ